MAGLLHDGQLGGAVEVRLRGESGPQTVARIVGRLQSDARGGALDHQADRVLVQGARLEVVYTGFVLEPWFADGDRVTLDGNRRPREGDLALCAVDGWGEIRRILGRAVSGGYITGLDPCPGIREVIASDGVLAVVAGRRGAGGALGRAVAAAFPFWSRWAALCYWFRKVREAPRFGGDAMASVQRKYKGQVESYTDMLSFPLGDDDLYALLVSTFPKGGSVLIAGSGAGGEAIHLARDGYRVTGFDFLQDMVRAAERNARAAACSVEFMVADMGELDLPGRSFEGIYVTPLVYSFVPTRARRVECLRRLGRHLRPDASVVFSAYLLRTPEQLLRILLTWARHGARDPGYELGDWFTWFLRPDGSLGKSFCHLFRATRVIAEAREAGFRTCRQAGAFFVARDFEI